MSTDLLQPPADPTEPHLVLTVHKTVRLPPLTRKLGPGVYHLAVDIRPLLRGRWRQPVAAGHVTFHWYTGVDGVGDPSASLQDPLPPLFTAPQIDATPELGPVSQKTVEPVHQPPAAPAIESTLPPPITTELLTPEEPDQADQDATEPDPSL